MIKKDSYERIRGNVRPQSAKNIPLIRYKQTYEDFVSEENQDLKNYVKFKKRLPSANNKYLLLDIQKESQHNEVNPTSNFNPKRNELNIQIIAKKYLSGQRKFIQRSITIKTYHMKSKIEYLNTIVQQNIRLKTKIASLQKEKMRIIKSFEEDNMTKTKILKMNPTELRLRRENGKSIKLQNDQLKKTLKFTEIRQLETENKQLYQELERLRLVIQKQMTEHLSQLMKQQNYKSLEFKYNKQYEENQKLKDEVKRYQQMNSSNKKSEKLITQNSRDHQNTSHSNITNKEFEQIQKKYKEEIKILKLEIQKLQQNVNIKKHQQLKQQNQRLRRQLMVEKTVTEGLTEKIQSLQKNIKEDIQKTNSITNNKNSIKQTLQAPTIVALPVISQTKQINQQKKQRLIQKKFEEANITGNSKYIQNKNANLDQITKIFNIMTYKFIAQRYSRQDILQILEQKKVITSIQLNTLLMGSPFFITSEQDRKLILEILTEGKKQIQCENLIKSLDSLLPHYQLFNKDIEEDLYVQCSENITIYYQEIISEIKIKQKSEGIISQQILEQTLRTKNLNSDHIKFIIGEISFFSDDLENLNYYAMFDKFYIPSENIPETMNMTHSMQKYSVPLHNQIQEVEQQFEESTPNYPQEIQQEYV